MEKKKIENPYIIFAVLFGVLTVLYISVTCLFAVRGILQAVIVYAFLTPYWGWLTGIWTHKAVSYRKQVFYIDGYYEKCRECIYLREKLIEALEDKLDDEERVK